MFIIFSRLYMFYLFPVGNPQFIYKWDISDLCDKIKFNIFIQQIVINRIYKAHTIRKLTMRFN